MNRRIRVLLGAPLAAALLLAGGAHVASAAEPADPSRAGGDELVAVSIGDRVNGLVRPEILAREAPAGMVRRNAPVHASRLAAGAELFALTVTTLDRTGAVSDDPDFYGLDIKNLDDSEIYYWGAPGVVDLPAGRYSVSATIRTPRAGHEPSYSIITDPELVLSQDRAVTLDARIGQPVSLSTDNPAARGGSYDLVTYTRISDCSCTLSNFLSLDPRFAEVYVATVPGVRSDTFASGQALRAEEPSLDLIAAGPEPFDVAVSWYPGSPVPQTRAALTAVLESGDVTGKLVLIDVPEGAPDEEIRARIAAVQARGGRMVLLSTDVYGDAEPLALPALQGSGPTVRRLFDLVRSADSAVEFASRSSTALRYDLAYGVTGAVTGPQVHRPSTAELAAVPTAYHESGPPATTYLFGRQDFFGSELGAMWSWVTRTPQQRTEYFTPGTWHLNSENLADTRTFRSGSNPPLAWNKAVAAPSLTGTTVTRAGERPWAWRDGGALDVILPMFTDSAGHARVPGEDDTGSITLHRDGVLVGTADNPKEARFPVPEAQARYRLTATAVRAKDPQQLSTKVSAVWGFRSGPADEGKPLPLLTVRFDPALSLTNEAKSRSKFTFPAYAPGATALTVDVSYDDGGTWQPAAVTKSKGHFAVTVTHPAGGFVSLRARAAGPNGSSEDVTVLRAYRIAAQG